MTAACVMYFTSSSESYCAALQLRRHGERKVWAAAALTVGSINSCKSNWALYKNCGAYHSPLNMMNHIIRANWSDVLYYYRILHKSISIMICDLMKNIITILLFCAKGH